MNKGILSLAAGLCLAPLLSLPVAAQALTGAGSSGPVTLHLVSCCKETYFGPAIEAWSKANPDIKIEQEVIPFAQLNDIIEARMRTKDSSFDLMVVDPPRTASEAARHYLLDLTAPLKDKLTPTTNKESMAAVSYAGKLYALPVFNSTLVLIYNPDMLENAGVKPPSIDPAKRVTWEEVVADAEKVKATLKLPYGLAFSQGHTFYGVQPIIMSAGGTAGLSGPNMLTPDTNSDAWKKAMSWYGDLYARGLAPRGVPFTQMDSLFTSRQLPFLITTTDRVREFENQKISFGVAALPDFAGGKPYTACDSFAIGINPYSQHQAQSVQFLTWLGTTAEGGYAGAAQSPNVPANLLVMDKVSQQMEAAGKNLDGLTHLISYEVSTTCAHRPASVGYIQFETEFLQANMDIINGAPVPARLDQMQKQLTVELSRIR